MASLLIGLTALGAPGPLRLEGLVAAVFSPFKEADGSLDLTVVPAQQMYLNATGVDWVFVSGTTGESLSLTVAERKALTDAWIATGTNVIAHVGAEAVADARELAAHAQAAGALAVGAMPPVFFKPATVEALALTMASICAAAPRLPCYYYHIPSMTGVAFPIIDLVKALEPLAPNFVGVKYTGLFTSPGFADAQEVMNYKGGKFEVFSGREQMMLEAAAIGIKGHVGSQFNFAVRRPSPTLASDPYANAAPSAPALTASLPLHSARATSTTRSAKAMRGSRRSRSCARCRCARSARSTRGSVRRRRA